MCFRIANNWCSKLNYSNYTTAMVVRNYDKLKSAAAVEFDKQIIKEHNIEKKKQSKEAFKFNEMFEINKNENTIKKLH